MNWKRRLGLMILGLAVLSLWMWQKTRLSVLSPDEAPVASALELRMPDGELIELADFSGQVVLVNLWASWCGPCRDETPGLVRVYEEFRDRGFRVVGVNAESLSPEQLASIAAEWGIPYLVVFPAGSMSGSFAGRGILPYSWLIDREGRVRATHSGYMLEGALRRAVRGLVEESGD